MRGERWSKDVVSEVKFEREVYERWRLGLWYSGIPSVLLCTGF